MLGIHTSYNGEAAMTYFNEGLYREGRYYLHDTLNVRWEGRTAIRLGIAGKEADALTFGSLVHNRHPFTWERLTVRNAQNRKAGYDFTFSAPKSISVMEALTKDPALLEAHRIAVRNAMTEIEAHMQTQANTSYGRFYESTGNIIYAAFEHFTSRPCAIKQNGKTLYISDPQLHTHCYLPNVTWNHEKQRFQAVEVGNIHRQAPYYEAVYHAHLSHALEQAGYTVHRTADRYEITGVPEKVLQKFSNRTQIIEQTAKVKGITDPTAKAKLGVTTRHSKAKAIAEAELQQHWEARLSPSELQNLKQLKDKSFEKPASITPDKAIDAALEHFLERNSTIAEKRLLAHALTLGYGNLLPEDVQQALDRRKDILRSEKDTISYITTREIVHAESSLIEKAVAGKGIFPALYPNYQPRQEFLNDGQREAIRILLESKDRVSILRGAAGVGKTALLTEIREAVQSTKKGMGLLAVAPSTQASAVLQKKGFDAETIAALLHNPKLQEKLKDSVLIVDEAGMCGVKTMNQLLELVQQYDNTRCILSGDTLQHGPPGQYGDALQLLQRHAGLQTARVSKIMRQKPEAYKATVQQFAEGKTLEGFNRLQKMGAVKEIPDTEARLKAIAVDYVAALSAAAKTKDAALIVSPTHYEGNRINAMVREELRRKGHLKGKEHTLDTLIPLSFTEAQKKDPVHYQQGQVVRFTKNQKGGYKAGGCYEVLIDKNSNNKDKTLQLREQKTGKVLPLPYQNPVHYQVYQKDTLAVSKGDHIRLTHNATTLEGTKVNNGTTYQVKNITKNGIQLTNGKTLPKDLYHFKHGYSETSYSSQGKTCREVFISMSDLSFAATNQAALYVAASRGTHGVTLYTSDTQELKKAISKSTERISALEVARSHEKQFRERMQRSHHHTIQQKMKQHHERTPTRPYEPKHTPSGAVSPKFDRER